MDILNFQTCGCTMKWNLEEYLKDEVLLKIIKYDL